MAAFLDVILRGLALAGQAVAIGGVLFVLVVLQMTTALRPIVGTADTFLPKEKKFFLNHWGECVKAAPQDVLR